MLEFVCVREIERECVYVCVYVCVCVCVRESVREARERCVKVSIVGEAKDF